MSEPPCWFCWSLLWGLERWEHTFQVGLAGGVGFIQLMEKYFSLPPCASVFSLLSQTGGRVILVERAAGA